MKPLKTEEEFRKLSVTEIMFENHNMLISVANAIEQLNRNAWVKVSDRLPNVENIYTRIMVACYIPDDESPLIWCFYDTRAGFTCAKHAYSVNPTHWMPMPLPPLPIGV